MENFIQFNNNQEIFRASGEITTMETRLKGEIDMLNNKLLQTQTYSQRRNLST